MSFKLQDFQAGIQLRVLVDKLTKIQTSWVTSFFFNQLFSKLHLIIPFPNH
jgi:hypothetical protein